MIKHVLLIILFFSLGCSQSQNSFNDIKISDVLKAHKNANEFHQWMESDFSSENYLQNKNIKCEDLSALSAEQLSIFYAALSSKNLKINLSQKCRETLIHKIESYYLQDSKVSTSIFNSKLNQVSTKNRRVKVNPTGGPVFWYGERGGLNKKEISLTFDDGPHPRLTLRLLDILDVYNVKATFFILGKNAKNYPEIVEEIQRRGHVIANHSYSHHNLPKYSYSHGVREIESGFDELLKITDSVQPFFRFPYGARTKALQKYLKHLDVATFFWDVDTLDWKKTNPSQLLEYSTEQVYKYNNGIVLFHDIQPQTISIMSKFLSELILNGYSFASYTADQ